MGFQVDQVWDAARSLDGRLKVISIEEELSTRWATDSVDTTLFYVGEAPIGSLESGTVWRIQKIDTTNGTVKFASVGNFDQVWTNRESLVYA